MSHKNKDMEQAVYRVPPYHYLHVLDQTTNVTRVEIGPQTFVKKDNEQVLMNPEKMVIVPPRHYCIIQNPVLRNEKGEVETDSMGQVRLDHAEEEIRLQQDPFPLYPGEMIKNKVSLLRVVPALTALKLRVTRDYSTGEKEMIAGDELLFEGPGTYVPRKEVEVVGEEKAIIIKPNQALRLRALRETVDRDGKARVAGEEWLVRKNGAYLPGVYEEIVETVNAYVLTEKVAVHVRAAQTFKDGSGKVRKSGEEYLITIKDLEAYIPDVYEEIVGQVYITTLTNRYFFLQPDENLEDGVQDVFVLGDNEGIVLRALENFMDEFQNPPVSRHSGDKWMLQGPLEYIPPVEVEVVTKRQAIPLHENEGIYVRNIKTGQVRAVIGQTYMLGEDEELWEKSLPTIVKTLLSSDRDNGKGTPHISLSRFIRDTAADRGDWINPSKEKSKKKDSGEDEEDWDASRVVTFQVPHNAAVQIYDYKSKKSRVVFGPDLVMLGPDEQFTQLRLQLELSYNWHFQVTDQSNDKDASKIFSVADFVGDLCKAMASKIRGAVSSVTFDDFHKHSATIIQKAVFGIDLGTEKESDILIFKSNNLCVTSVDIKSVEPVDQRTRDSLQKSVTLAIEITTQSQEAAAKREAERIEQGAKGKLERQRISDEALAEKERRELIVLQAESAAAESTGQAKAEAIARAEASRIEAEAAVEGAKLKAEALKIETEAELERMKLAREADIKFTLEQNKMEIEKCQEMAKIESEKFTSMVQVLGTETIKALASGPQDQQVRMLQALGLKSTLITDGRTPINLLNTASGLLGPMPQVVEEA
ncbi:major vault protein [Eurytemora carolleeae]|uniref:major vault protein n=1 Tax=Eurytemora carolleeae TaxID=1294199 RepID=UPI000C78794D|nr:major vault protein [Eurytemora carolleeae]|eukprot:XP_023330832.1 major vault protein-like [Eurytemora affinis]